MLAKRVRTVPVERGGQQQETEWLWLWGEGVQDDLVIDYGLLGPDVEDAAAPAAARATSHGCGHGHYLVGPELQASLPTVLSESPSLECTAAIADPTTHFSREKRYS